MPQKVWHLTRNLSGGAGLYALRLSNALRAHGLESSVLVSEGLTSDGVLPLRRMDSPIPRFGARVFRSLTHRISLGPFHSLRGPELYEATELIQAGDVVHLHGMTGWIGVSGLHKLIPSEAKVFWTAHDLWMLTGGCVVYRGCNGFCDSCSSCPILRSPWKQLAKLELRVKQSFVKTYDVQPVANSQWTARRICESKVFGTMDSIPVVPPIIHDAFWKPRERASARLQLDLHTDKFVVAVGARAVTDQFKGIEPFLRELTKSKELATTVLVLLFGDGMIPIPDSVQVREFGKVSDPNQLANILAAADVFVSPSEMETFGMALVESQACGTPVLGFSVGGVAEAVRDADSGWLVPNGDYQALLERLRLLMNDLPKCRAAGERARQWSRQTFCTDAIVRKQVAVYGDARLPHHTKSHPTNVGTV